MPRLQHVLESVPGGIAVAMFAGNTNQRFALCAFRSGIPSGEPRETRSRTGSALVRVRVQDSCQKNDVLLKHIRGITNSNQKQRKFPVNPAKFRFTPESGHSPCVSV
jgi:hypothetical protein